MVGIPRFSVWIFYHWIPLSLFAAITLVELWVLCKRKTWVAGVLSWIFSYAVAALTIFLVYAWIEYGKYTNSEAVSVGRTLLGVPVVALARSNAVHTLFKIDAGFLIVTSLGFVVTAAGWVWYSV